MVYRAKILRTLRKYTAKTTTESRALVSHNPHLYHRVAFDQMYIAMRAYEQTWESIKYAIQNGAAMMLNPLAYQLFDYYNLVTHAMTEVFFIHENENGSIPTDIEHELNDIVTRRDAIYDSFRIAINEYIRQHRR